MPERSVEHRMGITAVLLIAAIIVLHSVSHGERVPLHQPLRGFPMAFGPWQGQDLPIEQRIIDFVGVSDHLSRVYADSQSGEVGLYIGYYESQRTGDTIHSPKNCLPGAGWEALHSSRLTIGVPGQAPIVVNQYLVARGLDREFVLYWYQSRGRVVASEYWGKFWMVADAVTRNRTDGALVRVMTPARDGEDKARARAVGFVKAFYPKLGEFVPN